MNTLLGDTILNIEEEEYQEAYQHALNDPSEERIDSENGNDGKGEAHYDDSEDEDNKGGEAHDDDNENKDGEDENEELFNEGNVYEGEAIIMKT